MPDNLPAVRSCCTAGFSIKDDVMKLTKLLPLVILAVLALAPLSGWAQSSVGSAELRLLEAIFTGNIGFAIGLILAIVGAVTFAMGEVKNGIIMLVVGVLITLLPMVFNAARSVVCPAVTALFGGGCGQN
jgi:hypothetical protein